MDIKIDEISLCKTDRDWKLFTAISKQVDLLEEVAIIGIDLSTKIKIAKHFISDIENNIAKNIRSFLVINTKLYPKLAVRLDPRDQTTTVPLADESVKRMEEVRRTYDTATQIPILINNPKAGIFISMMSLSCLRECKGSELELIRFGAESCKFRCNVLSQQNFPVAFSEKDEMLILASFRAKIEQLRTTKTKSTLVMVVTNYPDIVGFFEFNYFDDSPKNEIYRTYDPTTHIPVVITDIRCECATIKLVDLLASHLFF